MRFPTALKGIPGLWPGIFCATLIYGAWMSGWTQNIERLCLDALFRARGPRDADPRVVIIAVDDAAVVRAGERTGVGWPLPRRNYARAVRELKALGAQTIAFDVLFSEPGPNPDQDEELARQCRSASVAQACAFQISERRTELPLDIAASPLPGRFALPNSSVQSNANNGSANNGAIPNLSRMRRAIWASAPLPALSEGAATLGHINVFPEVSGTLRRVPHLLDWREQLFPSLSLASTAHFLGEKPVLDAENSFIALGMRQIPLDSDGLTLINWIGAGESYPRFGLNQLLDGEVPAAAIRGRLVLIGVTALGAFENRATPFAGGISAVEFQANAIDDILSNRLLKTVPLPLSLALLLAFPLCCALLTMRRGAKSLWPVPILLFCLVFVGWLALKNDLYLPIGAPLAGGSLAFALTAALGYRREWEAVARADVAVSSLAHGTTLMSAALGASGRDRQRLISIIRATAHETLDAREVFLILDGDPPASNEETPSEAYVHAIFAAQRAQELGRGWVFPFPTEENRRVQNRRARSNATASDGLASVSAFGVLASGSRENGALSPEKFALAPNGLSDFRNSASATRLPFLNGETLVAAPLPRANLDAISDSVTSSNGAAISGGATSFSAASFSAASSDKSGSPRQFCGALVAVGKRDGGKFSARDAVLLETLAEGAALALENFGYAQTLRGRIESANRELGSAYQLLAEQSAKLFAAVESIDAALVVCDAKGCAAFVNPAGARVLRGATPILGEPVASALAAGDLEELATLFDAMRFSDLAANLKSEAELSPNSGENSGEDLGAESGGRSNGESDVKSASKTSHLASIRLETTRGREILSAQFTPLVSDENQFIGAMLVVADVSAQRELERMKTDFVGFVAHELRTPLTTILGYASLLNQAAGHFSADETRDMTAVIERHCRRMNSMISDLLDISRLESGAPLSVQRSWFDLDYLCERLLTEQKCYLNATPPLELRLECETRPLELFGDSDRIEQVMLNLLSNAVKYSPEGGIITVALQKNAENITVEVRDQGLGLSGAQIQQMFQKFYRTPDAKARGIKGNGLGLNLVRQLVEAHGGTIEVISLRDEGQRGSTFRIVFPNHDAAAA